MTSSMKQKLDAERERLAPTYNATTCSGTKGEYFVKGWDTAVDTVLRVLKEDGGEFDEDTIEKEFIEMDKKSEFFSLDFLSFEEGFRFHQPVIAALKLKIEVWQSRAEINGKKAFELMDENQQLKQELEITKQKSEVRGQSLLNVSEENQRLRKALRELKHQNHHTIEEEMWRIDKALKGEP